MDITAYHRATGLRRPPPGRAAFVARNVQSVADRIGYPIMRRYTDAVLDWARTYLDRATQRNAQRNARGGGDAGRVDKRVDTRVSLIHETCRRFATEQPESPEGKAGQYILRRYFGDGLRAVTGAPFEIELTLVEFVVEQLRGPDADRAEILVLGHHLDALEELLPLYRAALELEDKISAAEVGEAYETLQMRYLDMVFGIFTLVPQPEPRMALLGPIFDQDDRLAAIYAARRRGQDTGSVDLDAEAEALLAEELAADDANRAAQAEAFGLEDDDFEEDGFEEDGFEEDGFEEAPEDDALGLDADQAPEADPPGRPLGALPGRD